MNGKLTVLLLVLGLTYVAADEVKPEYWHGKGRWYGGYKPWNPPKPMPIWSPLQLVEATVVTSIPAGLPIAAGDVAVFWATVTCPANAASSADFGSCSWTGNYLAAVTAAPDAGLVDWTVVCSITSPCGGYGVGTISAIGRGDGTTGTATNRLAIVGGTGAYASLHTGELEAVYNTATGKYTYTFRFARK